MNRLRLSTRSLVQTAGRLPFGWVVLLRRHRVAERAFPFAGDDVQRVEGAASGSDGEVNLLLSEDLLELPQQHGASGHDVVLNVGFNIEVDVAAALAVVGGGAEQLGLSICAKGFMNGAQQRRDGVGG